eukprot:c12558_g1_i2.p1 GENE.c12558_g1_i2~~c12558_g1_i2.p1  ORF type:complete len:185 (+),score=36.46 c12558_g1_i2:94-648(+)
MSDLIKHVTKNKNSKTSASLAQPPQPPLPPLHIIMNHGAPQPITPPVPPPLPPPPPSAQTPEAVPELRELLTALKNGGGVGGGGLGGFGAPPSSTGRGKRRGGGGGGVEGIEGVGEDDLDSIPESVKAVLKNLQNTGETILHKISNSILFFSLFPCRNGTGLLPAHTHTTKFYFLSKRQKMDSF